MRAVDLIRKKRDGGELSGDEIRAFIAGATDGSWPDYQVSALLMAIVWRSLSLDETVALTSAMVQSGDRLDLSEFGGTPVDKHSTGGVGDKLSLIIAPLVAACGGLVPMMSGRGLGHTGGTLDKLESIPGFRTQLTLPEMRAVLRKTRCVLIGQTREIAPADRRLYALRDVTGTVESIPLICGSILSKKIAEGIGGLVLDVKVGSGAFMKTTDDARRLASWLVEIAERNGVRTEAILTGMDIPLGRAVGNANEVIESIETLKGRGPQDIEQLSLTFATRMLVLAGVATSEAAADAQVRSALTSGRGSRCLPRSSKLRAVTRRSWMTISACRNHRPEMCGRLRLMEWWWGWRRSSSAAPRWRWVPAATARMPASIQPPASTSSRLSARRSAAATPLPRWAVPTPPALRRKGLALADRFVSRPGRRSRQTVPPIRGRS